MMNPKRQSICRGGLFSLLTILACTTATRAAIFLQPSAPTELGQGLIQYTLRALSTRGEIIRGISNPTIVPHSGIPGLMGLHQVWTPITATPTPTRAAQLAAGPLWSDTWQPYDSYFFFEPSPIELPNFTETNSMSGGASLPSAGFGSPVTGFGSYGFSGTSASKFFSSSQEGTDVALAQLVMKTGEAVWVNLTVFGDPGVLQTFSDYCLGCLETIAPPVVGDLDLGDVTRGSIITATLPSTNPTVEPLNWSVGGLLGPGGLVEGATIDRDTGLFQWDTSGAPLGSYTAYLVADNVWNADVGALVFNLVIPEPSTITLLGLALFGAFGFVRRR